MLGRYRLRVFNPLNSETLAFYYVETPTRDNGEAIAKGETMWSDYLAGNPIKYHKTIPYKVEVSECY